MRFRNKNKLIEIRENAADNKGDSLGQKSKNWQYFTRAWASIEPISSEEGFKSEKHNSKLTYEIKTRFIRGVTTQMRIFHGQDEYEIIAPPINNKGLNNELIIKAVTRG